MKSVMKMAWELAKEGQKKFGGKVKEYLAESLRIVWAMVNEKPSEVVDIYANVNMDKVRKAIKQEIYEMERSKKTGLVSNWAIKNIEKLTERAIVLLKDAKASLTSERNISTAAFTVIDECY